MVLEMEDYNTVFGIKWPAPGISGIAAIVLLIFAAVSIYLIYKYFESKEQERIQKYQHFLYLAKERGLNNSLFKLLNNISLYYKLAEPKELFVNHALFEALLDGFGKYIQEQNSSGEDLISIYRNVVIIYQKLYSFTLHRNHLTSMAELEDGEILYLSNENGEFFLGKVDGRGNDFITVKLFSPDSSNNFFHNGNPVFLHPLRVNDAEYLIKTVTAGEDSKALKISLTDNFTRIREFRHPYINVDIPAILLIPPDNSSDEPEKKECSILKLNEHECVVRFSNQVRYDRDYQLEFEILDFKFSINTVLMSTLKVDSDRVYFHTLKFKNLTEAGAKILAEYVSGNL